VSTDQVEMLPTTAYSIKLSELNQVIAEQRGTTVDDLSLKSSLNEQPYPLTEKAKADEPKSALVELSTPEQKAKHYRSEADRLSKEAAALRRQAEELVPTAKKAKTEAVAEEVVVATKKAKVVNTDKATS
jgi:hypothetical protein